MRMRPGDENWQSSFFGLILLNSRLNILNYSAYVHVASLLRISVKRFSVIIILANCYITSNNPFTAATAIWRFDVIKRKLSGN